MEVLHKACKGLPDLCQKSLYQPESYYSAFRPVFQVILTNSFLILIFAIKQNDICDETAKLPCSQLIGCLMVQNPLSTSHNSEHGSSRMSIHPIFSPFVLRISGCQLLKKDCQRFFRIGCLSKKLDLRNIEQNTAAMPESFNSSNSRGIDEVLNNKLRHDAVILRKMINEDHANEEAIDETRRKMLNENYRMLAYTFGEPVSHFDFEYRTKKDNEFHRDTNLTPQEFFKKYVGWNLDNYISIIQAPTADKKYHQTYTIDMLGNVVGGREIKHLNLPMDEFKQLAIEQLKNGESVWFGSDVIKYSETKLGIMALNTYDYDKLFDVDLEMTKAEALDYGESMMDHAMVITGVDLVDGKPTKWKVENSWGNKVGHKGYFVMSDDWMDKYCYQVVINKKYLSEDLKRDYAKSPVVLKPWDPMGTLA